MTVNEALIEWDSARRAYEALNAEYVSIGTYQPGEDIRRPPKVMTEEALRLLGAARDRMDRAEHAYQEAMGLRRVNDVLLAPPPVVRGGFQAGAFSNGFQIAADPSPITPPVPALVRNAILWVEARDHVVAAIDRLSGVEGTPMLVDLVNALLIGQLEESLAVLDLNTDDALELLAGLRNLENTVGLLGRVKGIFEKYGYPAVEFALDKAMDLLAKVIVEWGKTHGA